jgi:mannose-6-phosphate isomerase-like protein (cupin superfamily)
MAKGKGYYRVTWDTLEDYPNETSRIYSGPLACANFAFLINRQLPNESGVLHAHDQAEEVYVLLRGRGVLQVEDTHLELAPLDAVRVEPGVQHASHNRTDEETWWLVAASPVAEFLEFDAVAYGPPADPVEDVV